MDFKDTLNMPKTDFEMKANLSKKEPIFQKEWKENKIEEQIYKRNKNFPKFTLHDGPPYANGNIHIGHALNKIIKDFIVRSKNMNGYLSKFIAGWDTHGMPIEVALMKTGKNKDPNLSIIEKRNNCKEFALKWIDTQKEEFSQLGLMTNFNEIYMTLDHKFQINQLKLFNKMIKDGLIYQDLKPIYWSWSSQTALADAEVEYHDHESNSIYVKFKITNSNFLTENDNLIVWTTTPWTIPSNKAIAVHPDYNYVKFRSNNEYYVVVKNTLEQITKEIGISVDEIVSEFKGKELENSLYAHSLYPEMNNPIILANYVSDIDGTGIVHNAPGFGHDDYLACKKYNIEVFAPIDEKGKFTNELNDEELIGIFYEDANEIIINRLINTKNLLKHSKLIHSVAHDWRTKKPLIYRATKQWFVNLSKISDNIIKSLDSVSSVQGQSIIEKIKQMVQNRQEWCISRQRYWGVPIIIIYDEDKQPIFDNELQENILNILNNDGVDTWFEKPVEYFLTEKYLSLNKTFYKEQDIMDVWFDSGTSHLLLNEDNNLNYPADLYFEGKDQFRGWFNSSLITSVAYNGFCPYKTLLTHGFTLDDKGMKMSKSLKNTISPLEISKEYGSDILRLLIASSDYSNDIRISFDIVKQIAEVYRRLRNSLFKFILGNLYDFDYLKNKSFKFTESDKYILFKLNELNNKIIFLYNEYDFKNIVKEINNFTIEISSFYFEYAKDSLYCDKPESERRRTIQTVLYYILESILILLTPIIPHTTYEAYNFFNKHNKKDCIFYESFKKLHNFDSIKINKDKWEEFFKLKNDIYLELEEARKNKIINKNNEAMVILNNNIKLPFEKITVKKLLNVSEIIFKDIQSNIKIENRSYQRCERCWNNFKEIYDKENQICKRCKNTLNIKD